MQFLSEQARDPVLVTAFLATRIRKIVGIGKNYVDHAKELASDVPKEPLLLMKPTSGLIGHGQPIVLPPQSVSREIHHESELAFVIGQGGKDIPLWVRTPPPRRA